MLAKHDGPGVAFTRDPATGEKKLMGEFLTNAQGEDVVARGMGKCCVSGCGEIKMDEEQEVRAGGQDLPRGGRHLHQRLHRQHL